MYEYTSATAVYAVLVHEYTSLVLPYIHTITPCVTWSSHVVTRFVTVQQHSRPKKDPREHTSTTTKHTRLRQHYY